MARKVQNVQVAMLAMIPTSPEPDTVLTAGLHIVTLILASLLRIERVPNGLNCYDHSQYVWLAHDSDSSEASMAAYAYSSPANETNHRYLFAPKESHHVLPDDFLL